MLERAEASSLKQIAPLRSKGFQTPGSGELSGDLLGNRKRRSHTDGCESSAFRTTWPSRVSGVEIFSAWLSYLRWGIESETLGFLNGCLRNGEKKGTIHSVSLFQTRPSQWGKPQNNKRPLKRCTKRLGQGGGGGGGGAGVESSMNLPTSATKPASAQGFAWLRTRYPSGPRNRMIEAMELPPFQLHFHFPPKKAWNEYQPPMVSHGAVSPNQVQKADNGARDNSLPE